MLAGAFACLLYPVVAAFRRAAATISTLIVAIVSVSWTLPAFTIPMLPTLILFGTAFGVILGTGINRANRGAAPLRIISTGTSVSLLWALIILVLNSFSGVPVLWMLAISACGAAAVELAHLEPASSKRHGIEFGIFTNGWMLLCFPFFLAMGGFWAFLGIYAQDMQIPHLPLLLSGGLLISCGGALLPVWFVRRETELYTISIAMAAIGGGMIYLHPSITWFIVGLTLNSIFLFSFLPIFLKRSSVRAGGNTQLFGVALYISGFALGGAFAGVVIDWVGFSGFGWIVIATAVPALGYALKA